jgi:hypothetical protein
MAFVTADKSGTRTATALSWLSALMIPSASGAAALAVDGYFGGIGRWTPVARGQFSSRVFLIETALVVIAAPVAGVLRVRRREDSDPSTVFTARDMGLSSRIWLVARPLIVGMTMVTAASAVTMLGLAPAIEPLTLALSHAIFWAAGLLLAALGAMCAAWFAEALDAAACALGIALIAGLGLFAAGPVVDAMPRRLIDVALVANPVVASASAANVDIFRTEPFYRLSPLAHIQIDYPAPAATFTWYALIAVAMFVVSARGLRRRARDSSFERMSA